MLAAFGSQQQTKSAPWWFQGMWGKRLAVCILLTISSHSTPAFCQVVSSIQPDGTFNTAVEILPEVSGDVYRINGGTIIGSNQFHSFDVFTVGTNDLARFEGSPVIRNIVGRVTGLLSGLQQSVIDGTVQSVIPGANLFLLNPAGFVFGPNAILDIGSTIGMPGSFHAISSDYVRLGDALAANAGVVFANPEAPTILSSAPVSAFGFLGQTPAPITVQGAFLEVSATTDPGSGLSVGQQLTMIGGNLDLNFDPLSGRTSFLAAPSGEVNLISVASSGEVRYPTFDFEKNLNGASFQELGSVSLSGFSIIDVSDNAFAGDLHSGTVRIRGGQLVMDSSFILANTFGDVDGAPTALSVNVSGDVALSNLSLIDAETFGSGSGGSVDIEARNVYIRDGSFIATGSFGFGLPGDIELRVSDQLSIAGTLGPGNESRLVSSGGSIILDAEELIVENDGVIRTQNFAGGGAGDIVVGQFGLKSVTLRRGGSVQMENDGSGQPEVSIVATEQIEIEGEDPSRIPTENNIVLRNAGAGGLVMEAPVVVLSNGAAIRVQSDLPTNETATLQIIGGELVSVLENSLISSSSVNSPAGAIAISAPSIVVDKQAQILGLTGGNGPAGIVSLEATSGNISIGNASRVASSTEQGAGSGGAISFVAADSVFLSGASTIESGSVNIARGNAGTVIVDAGQLVSLTGTQTAIRTETATSGEGGAIRVSARIVDIRNGATVSSSSLEGATGRAGEVVIQGDQVIFANDAQISSSSLTGATGAAGNVTIQGLTSPADSISFLNTAVLTEALGDGVGGDVTLDAFHIVLNSGTVSTNTEGTGVAGNIFVNAPSLLLMQNGSALTTAAAQAESGGNITLNLGGTFRMIDSLLSSSVGSTSGSSTGGNISINNSTFTILQGSGSQILANAFAGTGGQINITASSAFLADADSIVDASSQLGVSGSVNIQAPVQQVSGSITPLPESIVQAATLLRAACASRLQGEGTSTFVQLGRHTVPSAPEGWLLSPFVAVGQGGVAGGEGSSVSGDLDGIFAEGVQVRRVRHTGPLYRAFGLTTGRACAS